MLWHIPNRTRITAELCCGCLCAALARRRSRPEADVRVDPGYLWLGLHSLPCRAVKVDSRW